MMKQNPGRSSDLFLKNKCMRGNFSQYEFTSTIQAQVNETHSLKKFRKHTQQQQKKSTAFLFEIWKITRGVYMTKKVASNQLLLLNSKGLQQVINNK